MKTVRDKGLSAFSKYYEKIWGQRWPSLKAALLQEPTPVARANLWASSGMRAFYHMDAASIEPAAALSPNPGEKVLDMCSAPGGKALILFEHMQGQGELVLADVSAARVRRLKQVLAEYIPEHLRGNIKVHCRDANRFAFSHRDYFDKILLDAPCSGERHLLLDAKEMQSWSEARSRQLAQRQYSLLCAALLAVKPGGSIVYSTCSISEKENHQVIQRLLERKSAQVEWLPAKDTTRGERTELGMQILPDHEGCGPIWFAILRKKCTSVLGEP